MGELKERLLDVRFLAEVVVATVLMIVMRFFTGEKFIGVLMPSPQGKMILSYFVEYLIIAAMLVSVYFIEKKEVRSALFVPFSILLLIVTFYYSATWFEGYAVYYGGLALQHFVHTTVFYYIKAFANIQAVPILIAAMQLAKVVKKDQAKPFYGILFIQYVFITINVFLMGHILIGLKHPSAFEITLYQFIEYTIVYALFAFVPYFVSRGAFWKEAWKGITYAFKRFSLALWASALFVFLILFIPAFILNMGNTAQTLTVYSTARALMYFFTFFIFYLPAAFFVFISVKAKEDGQ